MPEKKLLIAIVDDYEPFRSATACLLESCGFATCSFESVVEFVGSGTISTIDCLLLDIRMPEIGGFAFQDCLRHTNYAFPVILCSGQNLHGDEVRALENGAFRFLSKPLDRDRLVATIQEACQSN